MRKILLIENDTGFLSQMAAFLRENGFDVEAAGNGAEGIKRALSSRPDLVLVGNCLGDMAGSDAAFWLGNMKRTRFIPVMLLSATARSSDPADGFKKHLVYKGVLSKAQPLSKILGRICSVLGISRGSAPLRSGPDPAKIIK